MTNYFIIYKYAKDVYSISFRLLPTDDIKQAYGIIYNEIIGEEIDYLADDLMSNQPDDFVDIQDAKDIAHDMIIDNWYRFSDIFEDVDKGVYSSIKENWPRGLFIINNRNKIWSQLGIEKLEALMEHFKDKNQLVEEHITDVVLDNVRKYYDV